MLRVEGCRRMPCRAVQRHPAGASVAPRGRGAIWMVVLALLLSTSQGYAQDRSARRVIDVVVRDSAAGAAVSGARVSMWRDSSRTVTTDREGKARFEVPRRTGDSLVVGKRGFARVARAIPDDDVEVLSLEVTLAPAAQELAERRVEDRNTNGVPEGRWADFDRRRTSGSLGKFLTEEEIDRRRATRMTDLFRGFSSVRVVDSANVRLVVSNRGPNPTLISKSVGGGPCVLKVMIDGIMRTGLVSLDDLDPKEIHGIEIYVGPGSVPPSLTGMQRESWCGLIAVWSK